MGFKNRFYPHLLPDDIVVWERFLSVNPNRFDRIDYDIRVGNGSTPDPNIDLNYQQMWRELSQKRIDAIGYNNGLTTIIEITRRAGMKAIGQMVVYPILYRETFPGLDPIQSLLIAEELLPDIENTLLEHDIKFLLFPRGSGSPEYQQQEYDNRGT